MRRVPPTAKAHTVAAAQIRALLERQPADHPVPLCVFDAGYDPDLPIAGRPAGASFDTLTSTIGEAAQWTIEESGTLSLLFKARMRL